MGIRSLGIFLLDLKMYFEIYFKDLFYQRVCVCYVIVSCVWDRVVCKSKVEACREKVVGDSFSVLDVIEEVRR